MSLPGIILGIQESVETAQAIDVNIPNKKYWSRIEISDEEDDSSDSDDE